MRPIKDIFQILTAGLMTLFVVVGAANATTSFRVSIAKSEYKANHNQVCISEFGTGWEEADWTDLESYYSGGGNMSDLISSSGFDERKNAWVTRNGDQSYSSTRDYFASYHNHNKPSGYLAHDNINNYFLSLGSWDSSYYVLCKKDGSTPPPLEPQVYGLFMGQDQDQHKFTTDAVKLRAKMVSAGILKKENSTLLISKINKTSIEDALEKFKMQSDDSIILFYSGHGGTSSSQSHKGETTSSEFDEFIQPEDFVNIYDDELYDILSKYNNINKLVIIDACHSGGFWGDEKESGGDLEQLEKIGFIAATSETWLSASYLNTGEGIMTHHLLTGLDRHNGFLNADYDKDDTISLSEWKTYLNKRDWYQFLLGVEVRERSKGDIIIFTEDFINRQSKQSSDFAYSMKKLVIFPWPMFLPAITGASN